MSNEFPAFIKAEYVEGDAFSRFQRDYEQATQGFRQKFAEASQEAQRLLNQAISLPRNNVGSLDLGVPQLRAAAEAQQARAIAAREVANATAIAAKAEGDYSAQARAALAATQALAREEEEAARAARAHADAAEQVQRALNLQKSATDLVVQSTGRGTTANRINTESQRAKRFAMIQAGQQLQDITVSLQSGQRATAVFAQQLPQLAFAFTDVGGKVGAFAQFLAGPWGVAVFGAVTVLGFLIEHLVTAGQESDDLSSKSLALSQALDKETFATKEGLQALKDFNAEKERARAADSLAIDDSIRKAEARRRDALATREALQAEIERAAQANPGSRFDDGSGGAFEFGRSIRIAGLESRLEANQQRIDELNKSLGNLGIDKAVQDAKALSDPIEAINQRFDKMADAAKRAAAGTYLVGDAMRKASNDALKKTLADIEKQRQAEIDAQRDRDRASSSTRAPSLPPVTMSEVANILGAPITSGLRTQAQNRAMGGAPNSLHLIGQAIDIPLTVNGRPLTKAGIRTALEAAGVKVREILGPGDNGHDDHFHIGFDRKRQRPDQVASAAGREADEAARQLEQLAGRIQAIQNRFDPATKAANDFADALATIKEAEGSGLISERESFDLQIKAMAEQYGEMARIQRETTDQFMRAFEPQQLRSAAEEYADYLEQKWEAAQSRAANAFVTAVETADFLSALFRGRVGARDVFRLINPNDRRIRDGVSGTASGIDRFLYGKTSNFREIAEGKPAIQGGFIQSYTKGINDLKEAFAGSLEKVLGKDASKIGGALGKAFAGAEIGGMTSDLLEGLGVQNSKLGSQIGGAIGSAFGPIGSLIGSVIGGLGVEALKPAKRGSATIGGSGGNLIISSTRGNSQSRIKQSTQMADEAITTLERIAQALGGTIDASRGAVSIGVRDKNFRVDTSGRGITKTKKGAVDFGDDSAAAIRFATLDLIQDGVVQGIRASTQRILQSGKDLESAIQKAVDFQSVFDRLQERLDPVAAAITGIEREFTRLRNIFAEAGASAEEYADLEKLYQLERTEAIKEANERVLGSMKALLDDLRFGDNGRSLRDRLAAAQAKFDPLAARVQAGDITAYDDFAEAARALLDIQRQFSGSQTAFFELQDKITRITASVVEGGNVTSILSASAIPSAQAQSQLSYDGSNVVAAIDQLGDRLVQVLGGQLVEIRENTTPGPVYGGSGGGGFNIPGFFAQNVKQI
ncbi:D-Ala-D-Ala carboxypeptidase family metallohydrolase [Blastomonas sp. CCH2-A2]|uniref:D-Ala-D-Ala carboxypeptidase family metallohydrolase n=1 Tax=Blastomonas sp. CCH2-A2 TaxID=1768788 RepID=UPI0008242E7B|nr:D-Ala-D-Ala carboxypeptidase family metallohydrolase [Blastomonas sp. CCH2-A2]